MSATTYISEARTPQMSKNFRLISNHVSFMMYAEIDSVPALFALPQTQMQFGRRRSRIAGGRRVARGFFCRFGQERGDGFHNLLMTVDKQMAAALEHDEPCAGNLLRRV